MSLGLWLIQVLKLGWAPARGVCRPAGAQGPHEALQREGGARGLWDVIPAWWEASTSGGAGRAPTLFVLFPDLGGRGRLSLPTPSPGQRGTQMALVYSGNAVCFYDDGSLDPGGGLLTRPGDWG